MSKAIITCAPTGAIHTPSMSKYLPYRPDDIANHAIEAAKAGAAVLHLHARDQNDGSPLQTEDAFRAFLPKIKKETNAIINITTGGSPHMSVAERLLPAKKLKPELASLNMGSMNFGLFPLLNKYSKLQYTWEKKHLENSVDLVFKNTFSDIETILKTGTDNGTKFEFECYDTAHLYNLAYFADRGLIDKPFLVQTVFGIFGGIGSHHEDVFHMRRTANRLFGEDYVWSVLGAGKAQMQIAALAAAQGGSVRVGLEDSIWLQKGQLAKTSAQQVKKVRTILEGLSIEIAQPDDAREILKLKGADHVNF